MLHNIKVYPPKGSNLSTRDIDEYISKSKEYTNQFYSKLDKENHTAPYVKNIVNFALTEINCDIFLTDMWAEHLEEIKSKFYDSPFTLLTHDIVRYAIYLTTAKVYSSIEIIYLEKYYQEHKLTSLLSELPSYLHTIIDQKYQTSESRVHHLTHLTYAQSKLDVDISSMSLIVEFGGGYGGMTSLLKLFNNENTVIVIDLPLMLNIQYYYLYPKFRDMINVISSEDHCIVKGKINLCPISLAGAMNIDKPDLFIATWSLSEANEYTQNYIVNELQLFRAKHVLYGYRKYDVINPRQPCSSSLNLGVNYDVIEDKTTFWTLDLQKPLENAEFIGS